MNPIAQEAPPAWLTPIPPTGLGEQNRRPARAMPSNLTPPCDKSRPPDLERVPMSDSLRGLARRGQLRFLKQGTRLIRQGESGQTIYIIVCGALRVYASHDTDEARELTIGIYLPGEYVGEMSLDGGPRTANVEAYVHSWVVVVARPTLDEHVTTEPMFAYELIAKVIRRARDTTTRLKVIALNDVEGRLVWWLNNERIKQDRGEVPKPDRPAGLASSLWVVCAGSTRTIAKLLGCTHGAVIKGLHGLEKRGYLVLHENCIGVLRALPVRY
jgi:CRP/FNR family cyclic AMP-dependent transcriptional regulator